jgi:hypothetical protein
VYFTYVLGPKRDSNMNGPLLSLEIRITQVCGKETNNAVQVTRENWQWTGPEVIRTYPANDVIARIKPNIRHNAPWRAIPFRVQLVYRDNQARITRTETYSSVAWEPVVK